MCDQLGRHRHRRLGSVRAFGLHLGQLIVLQLDQALEFVQLALQIRHATFQFGIVAPGRIEAFLSDGELVAQRFAVASRAFATRFAGIRGNQTQIIFGCCLRRRGIATRTLGGVQLLRARGQAAAQAPGSILRGDFGNSLRLRQAGNLLRGRQTQYLTGFQPIDIAVDKGIRVQCLNRQHGLLDRTAVTSLRGNLPKGVAPRSGVLRRPACPGERSGDRSSWSWRGLSSGFSGLRGKLRRIQQHAVITQQTAARPHHLHQKLDHRLGQRFARSHAQNAFATGIEYRGEGQVIEECLTVDTSLGELFR